MTHRTAPDLPHPPPGPGPLPDPAWLAAETDRLLDGVGQARAEPSGFWWLDAAGRPDRSRGRQLWICARMTHCAALGSLLGRDGDAATADHGVRSLATDFADQQAGGWLAALPAAGAGATQGDPTAGAQAPVKGAYEHAFVLLAAASATVAGRPGAAELLAEAGELVELRFWDEAAGMVVEQWDGGFTRLDPYRGANANMHTVEAFLAVADATGDPVWRQRALRIATRLIDVHARAHDWRVPEHFDADWTVLPDYNAELPDHPFRPYGATPGHGLEWARLLLHLAAAAQPAGEPVPDLLLPAAEALFARAVGDAWDPEHPGLCYTTDWQGRPVVSERFHWVLCEAIAAATVLHRVTGRPGYADWAARFWSLARERFLDGAPGWRHEVAADGAPSSRTWTGRPDLYHAVQATLLPRLPLTGSLAASAAAAKRVQPDSGARGGETAPSGEA